MNYVKIIALGIAIYVVGNFGYTVLTKMWDAHAFQVATAESLFAKIDVDEEYRDTFVVTVGPVMGSNDKVGLKVCIKPTAETPNSLKHFDDCSLYPMEGLTERDAKDAMPYATDELAMKLDTAR